MVVLLLIAVWGVILVPVLWRRRSERHASNSIESFHHQLHLLERAGPKIVAPAFRLETAFSGTGLAPGQSGLPAVSSMPGRPNLVLLRPATDDDPDEQVVDPATGNHYRRAAIPTSERLDERLMVRRPPGPGQLASRSASRARARRRRQDILLGLAGTVVVTALVGLVPALHLLWVLTGLAAVALVGFLALVATAQRLAAEARPMRSPSWSDRRPWEEEGLPGTRAGDRQYEGGAWADGGYETGAWADGDYEPGHGYAEGYALRPRVAAAGR